MEVLLFGAMGAVAAGAAYNTISGRQYVDDRDSRREPSKKTHPIAEAEQPVEECAPCEDGQPTPNCRETLDRANSVPGRFDNLGRLQTAYNRPESDLDCTDFTLANDPKDTPLSWGMMPQVRNSTGYARPDWSGPYIQKPPSKEVSMQQMYEPEPQANKHWASASQGLEWARDAAFNSGANLYNNGNAAPLAGYTPFDFDDAGNYVGRTGYAAGQHQTQRYKSNLRIIYPGELLKGLIQYRLRPAPGGPVAGGANPGGIGQMQSKGRTNPRDLSNFRRDPIQTRAKRHMRPEIGDVDLKHTNRQTGYYTQKGQKQLLMEALLARS